MNQGLQLIKPDSNLLKTLTCIPEKFIVDFANGIDVSGDHLQVQRQRSSFFSRCFDGFTGNGARRQGEINASLIESVEGSLKWLTELSRDLVSNNYAIIQVKDRVTKLTSQVTELALYSEKTRQRLDSLAQELDERMLHLGEEVARIDFNQKVIMHLDQVFHKWAAGRFIAFSPAGRCYAAIEELRWGSFGDYCRIHTGSERNNFIEQVVDRATVQLTRDVDIAISSRLGVYDHWLKLPRNREQYSDWHDALTYLATDFEIEAVPLISTITQKLPERLGRVPLIANASRIAETIVCEVFMEVEHA